MVVIGKSPEVAAIKRKIVPILRKNGIKKAGIFGSYARGEQKRNSDIDILVEINDKRSLIGVINLQLQLQDALKRKVDLLEYKELDALIKKQVLKEEVKII
jgi:hypothetical protein